MFCLTDGLQQRRNKQTLSVRFCCCAVARCWDGLASLDGLLSLFFSFLKEGGLSYSVARLTWSREEASDRLSLFFPKDILSVRFSCVLAANQQPAARAQHLVYHHILFWDIGGSHFIQYWGTVLSFSFEKFSLQWEKPKFWYHHEPWPLRRFKGHQNLLHDSLDFKSNKKRRREMSARNIIRAEPIDVKS